MKQTTALQNGQIIYSAFVICLLIQTSLALCPFKCDCTHEPSHCPAGVSLVTDGCNCCRVCAKQLGQQCNDDDDICDVHRHLYCDYSESRSGDIGICRARSGKPCWHGDARVPSGSMFEPSCKKRCWCMDGAIGCVPLCPHETQVPRYDRCPNARLQTMPGQCCDQWACDTSSGKVVTLPLENFWDEYVDDKSEDSSVFLNPAPEMGNGIREGAIYEDDFGENIDDVIDYQMTQVNDVERESNLERGWHDKNLIPGDIDARRHKDKLARERRCQVQTSAWSPCSKTCGLGVSTRVTNNNPSCQLERDTRLCEMRPCKDNRYSPKKNRQCLRQKRARKRVSVKYAGCVSVRKTKPRYCGNCHDQKKCCTPKLTRTARVRFRCEDGTIFSKQMLVVRSCHCHRNCASLLTNDSIRYSLFGDKYSSRDR